MFQMSLCHVYLQDDFAKLRSIFPRTHVRPPTRQHPPLHPWESQVVLPWPLAYEPLAEAWANESSPQQANL